MLRGLYSAAAAMLTAATRQDELSANLANMTTPGYKAVMTQVGTLATENVQLAAGGTGPLPLGVRPTATATDWSEGGLQGSANPLAAALVGPGFFAVQTPAGTRYTRDGDFHLSATGTLVTASGQPVLGPNGPIVVPPGGRVSDVRIGQGGSVLVDGRPAARLLVVAAGNLGAMVPAGGGLWSNGGGAGLAPVAQPDVRPGMLEASNVNPIREMVAMMDVQRVYESAQQMIKAEDTTLGVAVQQVGKVG